MTLIALAKRAERLIVNNSPVILTAIGITGTVVTAYLTGKATFKAADLLREETNKNLLPIARADNRPFRPLETKEKIELIWKFYVPPVIVGSLTIAAIFGANHVGTRRAAALAAAYSLSERALEEYKAKVLETIGAKREQAVRDGIAQDRVNENPVDSSKVIIAGTGEVLCYETYTDRYFTSDMEALRKAQNDINHQVLHDMYASLTDFYHKIGLPPTKNSDEVGWNSDKMLELQFSGTLTSDNRPCMAVDFVVAPVRHYHRLS